MKMNTTELVSKAKGIFCRLGFQLKKHSPEILIVAGVVGTVASAVMACRATTKISTILDKTKQDVDRIHQCMNDESLSEEYSEADAKKDLTIVYTQTCVKFVKLYAPSVILGALSLGSILASNNILRKRNVALVAAYTALDKGFKGYRSRVAERFGEDVEKELRYNVKATTFEETIVDPVTGQQTKAECTLNVSELDSCSDYARFFDETSSAWEKDAEQNLFFLKSQQSYFNDRLKANGHVFLNEVYDALGIKRTKAGQIVGWRFDPDHPTGDNYIDFGLYRTNREKVREFVNGYEKAILLDFNVDGPIFNTLEK